TPGDYTASIDWGDGTPGSPDVTPGLISGPDAGGTFTVTGSHTYHAAATFTAHVSVAEADNPATAATATSTVQADGVLTVAGTNGDATLVLNATNASSGSSTPNGDPSVDFAGVPSFTFLGWGGNDTFVLHNPAAGRFAPVNGTLFDGGGQPGDNLVQDGGGS